ncbi:MAG: glycosyltransferase family protein, partial [Candidatus Adiutrix sp.]
VNVSAYINNTSEKLNKIYDFGFVGVINETVRPKRSRLIKQLSSRFTLKSMGDHLEGWVGTDDSVDLYRQSHLVLNENLFPGVTTRMFEAMASGTVLFTEKAGGDLGELFQVGEDFAWFEPQELFESAEYWLGNEERLQKVAARAQEKMINSHDITHRAETILAVAEKLNRGAAAVGPKAWDLEGRTLFQTALRWPNEDGKNRISRAERLFVNAAEEGALSGEGKFMLGHIARLKGELEKAVLWLTRSWEDGFPRAALGMGILSMSRRKQDHAARWLGDFTGLASEFPPMEVDMLHFEAVLPIAQRLRQLGQIIQPGFDLMPHDPSLWNAFEFYLSAHRARVDNLEVAQALSRILLDCGGAAEAMAVAGATLEHHPQDEILSEIFSQGARASYLRLN